MTVMLVLSCLFSGTETEPEPLVLFDLEQCVQQLPEQSVLRYDVVKLVACLQGLVNRERPRLLIRFLNGAGHDGQAISIDDYWLNILQQGWLKDRAIVRITDLDELLARFPEAQNGLVLWDEAVPATSNVAATICGVEGWLPVRAGSALCSRIVDGGPKLPCRLSLEGRFDGAESGSAKCDAYLWAKREYLDKGRCHPALMAYYVDAFTQRPGEAGCHYPDLHNAGLANQDYYIANRAFFFDLGPWHDESPVDDPDQPAGTDRRTLCALLKSLFERNGGKAIACVGGFVPWNQKYTTHGAAGGTHEPVPTEWEYAAILSAHNAIMDADALGLVCLCNASAYMHYPLKDRYTQNPRPARQRLEPKSYVLIYMGDYDSAAWLSRQIPVVWDDPARGNLPMAWAFNPNLSDRVPYVFDHVYRTKTEQDWFIAGDSGAGYLNPNLLAGARLDSGLPDALDLWVAHNKSYFRKFDYSITGFVINGFHGDMPLRIQEAYAAFSPDGVGMQLGYEKPFVNGTPFLRHARDIYPNLGNLDETAKQIVQCAQPDKPQFLIFRMILQKPRTVKAIRDLLVRDYSEHAWEFCDPYTFFDLLKRTQ